MDRHDAWPSHTTECRIYRIDDTEETTWVVATSPEDSIKCAEDFLPKGVPLDSVHVSEETDLGRLVILDDGTTRTLREELAADPTPRIVCGTWT